MKLLQKLYYITDGNEYILVPEKDLRKDSDALKALFGLSSYVDVQLMTLYNSDFRKQIADAYKIQPNEVKQTHVIRLASIKEVENKSATFPHPIEVAEGIYDVQGTTYQKKIS